MRKLLIALLSAFFLIFGAGVAPAAAQDIALEQLITDGFFFDDRQAGNLPAAANASDLANLGVATIVLDSGGPDFAQAQAVSTLDTLLDNTGQYHTVIVVADDGTDNGNNGIGIDSVDLTNSEQDDVIEAMIPRLAANDLADAISAAQETLPAGLTPPAPDIARESEATSGLEPGALGEDPSILGSDTDDATTSGLEPGALDNDSTTSSDLDLGTDETTTTESTGGGFSFGRIIFWGVILFIGYRILKWFLGRKRRQAVQTQQGPIGRSQQQGPFSPSDAQSSGGGLGGVLGGSTRRRGGSVLGSIAGAALPSILGSVLRGRSNSSTSSTGLSSSSTQTPTRRSGRNIFSGGRIRRRSSSGGRRRSFRRSGRGRKRSF